MRNYRAGLGTHRWAADRVVAERMHALIMKASVGSKLAIEDTVTDTQTEHFIIITVLCIFQSLVTIASNAMWAKREQRSR